jgi:hypothetical protein
VTSSEPNGRHGEPRTDVERVVLAIWQKALNTDRVGVRDSLCDLGGDSVTAGQIMAQVNAAFGIALHLEELIGTITDFDEFTVERMAELAESAVLDVSRKAESVPVG